MRKLLQKNIFIVTYWCIAIAIIIARIHKSSIINLALIPFLYLSIIYDYHRKIGKNQTIYFCFFFLMLGDLLVISSDYYYFISGLIAYWGAVLFMNFTLYKELTIPVSQIIKKPIFYLPFSLYGFYLGSIMIYFKPFFGQLFGLISLYVLTLNLTCTISFGAYFYKKTKATLYLAVGFTVMGLAASLLIINKFYLNNILIYGSEILLYAPSIYLIYMFFITKSYRES